MMETETNKKKTKDGEKNKERFYIAGENKNISI